MTTRAPITWTLDYGPLKVGTTYVVARPFKDFDGTQHEVGAGWLYLGHNYFAREEGLTLYVVPPAGAFDSLRLQCVPEEQGPVVDALGEHLVPGDIPLDHAAFARTIASQLIGENSLWRQLALEVVARMPTVPIDISTAVIARLQQSVPDDEVIMMLMALYNVGPAAALHRGRVQQLRGRLAGPEALAVADAVLKKLGS